MNIERCVDLSTLLWRVQLHGHESSYWMEPGDFLLELPKYLGI